jgi:hypothetical protein
MIESRIETSAGLTKLGGTELDLVAGGRSTGQPVLPVSCSLRRK